MTAEADFDTEYFMRLYNNGLELLLDTPRKVTLFRNAAISSFASVRNEVHSADFLAIEGLRLFCRQAYVIIRENANYFIDPDPDIGNRWSAISKDDLWKFHQRWLAELPINKRHAVETIVIGIFPEVYSFFRRGIEISLTHKLHNERLMARHKDKFSIYFQGTVPEYQISNAEMLSLISCTKDELITRLKTLSQQRRYNGSSRLLAFLEAFPKYVLELTPDQTKNFIAALLSVGDELTVATDFGRGKLGLPVGNQERIYWLIKDLLKHLKEEVERYTIFATSLSKESVLTGTRILSWLQEVDKKGPQIQHYEQPGNWPIPRDSGELETFFSPQHLKKLQGIAVNRMQEAGKATILSCPDPRYVFMGWADWDPTSLREFAKEHFGKKEDILELLLKFSKTNVRDHQTLDVMFGLDQLANYLNTIPSDSLTDDQRSSIEYAKLCVQAREDDKSRQNSTS